MLIGTRRRARRSERREWRKSRQGTRNERGLVIQISIAHKLSRKFSPFPELLHFLESQLPVDSVDNLDPPVRRDLYVPAVQIIEKYELVVDLPDSRSSAYLRDDLQADRIESKRSVRLADGPPRNERLPENGISVRGNRREFRGSQIPCCVGACHAPKEFQKGGTRASRDANVPICGQSHSPWHESAGLAVSDLEKFVDNFSFLVVMDSCLCSLIQLRKGSELCGLQSRNLGPESGDFPL